MNITMLKSSSYFAAVDYNEDKVRESRANLQLGTEPSVELVATRNFPVFDASIISAAAKKKIMDDWCASSRTVNRQVHIVVSCKGHTNTVGELKDAALMLLDKSGYAKCPRRLSMRTATPTTCMSMQHYRAFYDSIHPERLPTTFSNDTIKSKTTFGVIPEPKEQESEKCVPAPTASPTITPLPSNINDGSVWALCPQHLFEYLKQKNEAFVQLCDALDLCDPEDPEEPF